MDTVIQQFNHASRLHWDDPPNRTIRWGKGERADAHDAVNRLLDAARFCFQRLGLDNVSMSDIAVQAYVTRPTVYRYFKSRQDIARATIRRELNLFWDRLESDNPRFDDFGDHIVEALACFIEISNEDGNFLFSSASSSAIVRELLVTECLTPGATSHPVYSYSLRPGATPPADIAPAVEWYNRLALSYITCPSASTDPKLLRKRLAALCPWKAAHFDT